MVRMQLVKWRDEDVKGERCAMPIECFFGSEETRRRSNYLKDLRPMRQQRSYTVDPEDIKILKDHGDILLKNYGRYITITIKDDILNIYKTEAIHRIVYEMLKRYCKDFLVLPDYDKYGRLHYHGVFTVKKLEKIRLLHRNLTKYIGFNKIDVPRDYISCDVDYMFKIYEKNKHTDSKIQQERLKVKYIIGSADWIKDLINERHYDMEQVHIDNEKRKQLEREWEENELKNIDEVEITV